MELQISSPLLDEIKRLAAAAPGVEICGLLLGEGGRVDAIRPCANVSAEPHDSFEIDPVALIAAHRACRSGQPGPIGHYHSHPGGVAIPSDRDAAAAEPGSYWIIVAGDDLRCWRALPGARFAPVAISCDNR